MNRQILDFRFGWRWLLPSQCGGAVSFHGLSAVESEYLSDVLAPIVVRSQSDAFSTAGLEAAQVVCVRADRASGAYWDARMKQSLLHVREYALLPAGNPRVVVPLSSSHLVVAALGMHRAGSLSARLGVAVARFLARLGNFWLLRSQILLIATRDPGLLPMGAMRGELTACLNKVPVDYVLYLGTANDNRKTVVLPLGNSVPRLILKVAETAKARASVQNEAAVLELLSRSSIANYVPKLGRLVESNKTITLYQEYRPRQQVSPRKMRVAVVEFLACLSRLTRHSMPLPNYLGKSIEILPSSLMSDAYESVLARLDACAATGTQIWLHRNHGDFAPWNCAWTDRGMFVFDWEESREQTLALGDAFYYAIAPALHIQRRPSAKKTLNMALFLAGQVAAAGGLGNLDIRLYLALWLLERVSTAALYGKMLVLLERDWHS